MAETRQVKIPKAKLYKMVSYKGSVGSGGSKYTPLTAAKAMGDVQVSVKSLISGINSLGATLNSIALTTEKLAESMAASVNSQIRNQNSLAKTEGKIRADEKKDKAKELTGKHLFAASLIQDIEADVLSGCFPASSLVHVAILGVHKGVDATGAAASGHNDAVVLASGLNGEGIAVKLAVVAGAEVLSQCLTEDLGVAEDVSLSLLSGGTRSNVVSEGRHWGGLFGM